MGFKDKFYSLIDDSINGIGFKTLSGFSIIFITISGHLIFKRIGNCKLGYHKHDIFSNDIKEITIESIKQPFIARIFNRPYVLYKVRERKCQCGNSILEYLDSDGIWKEGTSYFEENFYGIKVKK